VARPGQTYQPPDDSHEGHVHALARVPAVPIYGAQLLVRWHGFVIACADPAELACLGVDMSRMAVVARW